MMYAVEIVVGGVFGAAGVWLMYRTSAAERRRQAEITAEIHAGLLDASRQAWCAECSRSTYYVIGAHETVCGRGHHIELEQHSGH